MLIYSIAVASVLVPVLLARRGRPRAVLPRTVVATVLFLIGWILSVWVLVPRLL
jgi:hypothetical protein